MSTATKSTTAYWIVFAALMALLWSTYELGRHDLGVLNFPAAMLIATTKAVLIAAVFMNLRRSFPLVRLFAAAGAIWLAILFIFTAADYLTRGS